MKTSHIAQWTILAVVVLILGATAVRFEPGEPVASGGDHRIEIVRWNWKKDRSGGVLAVYGAIRNLTDREFPSVLLELRTVAGGKTLARHSIRVHNVLPGVERPFREDVPRTGQEELGYLSVKTVETGR